MSRTYLHVPPEEYAEAEVLGALWDGDSKRWYSEGAADGGKGVEWPTGDSRNDTQFAIASDQARIASASVACTCCGKLIELICLYCEAGSADGEGLEQFTVTGIWDVDPVLSAHLERWPGFRMGFNPVSQVESFCNHCRHCGAVQDEILLHCEPDGAFFSLPDMPVGTISFMPLPGEVRLNGDYHFEVRSGRR